MRLRTWRGTTAVAPLARRKFPWVRLLLLALVVAIAAYLLLPSYFFVSADALVQGDLVPVTPLYRARIDRLFVQCDDRVQTGQKLAVISNFLVQADYQKQYEDTVTQLNLSRIALDEGVAQARTEQAIAREKFNAAAASAHRLQVTFQSYTRAYKAGAIPRVEWESKKGEWQIAAAVAAGLRDEVAHAGEHVRRVDVDQRTKISSDQDASKREATFVARIGAETMRAPVGGYIVDCKERPQNVVEPGAPVFDIFQPERAYVLAFFNPAALDKVHIGERVDVRVMGLTQNVQGRVTAVYPDLTKLPDQLTRFFWQHEQWSEYRPVRIALDRVPRVLRDQLYYGAQSTVKIQVHDRWHPLFGWSWPAKSR